VTSKEFKKIVGAITSMNKKEQKALTQALGCTSQKKWGAKELLEDIAYNSSDLGIAAAALAGLNEGKN